MARERGVLSVQQYKDMAREHTFQMNQLIQTHNQQQREAHRQHLGHFVHEALGQMGAQELIEEWEELNLRQAAVQARFARLMGEKNVSITTFLAGYRTNFLDDVYIHSSRVPPAFYEALESVLARHGVKPSEATQVPKIDEQALLAKLRQSQSPDEVKMTILQSQMAVIKSLGIELPRLPKTNNSEGSVDGTV